MYEFGMINKIKVPHKKKKKRWNTENEGDTTSDCCLALVAMLLGAQ